MTKTLWILVWLLKLQSLPVIVAHHVHTDCCKDGEDEEWVHLYFSFHFFLLGIFLSENGLKKEMEINNTGKPDLKLFFPYMEFILKHMTEQK